MRHFHPMLAGINHKLVILHGEKMTRDEMLVRDWEKLIGYRVLVNIEDDVKDFMVNKIAPKSGYIELLGEGWHHVNSIELLEVLG